MLCTVQAGFCRLAVAGRFDIIGKLEITFVPAYSAIMAARSFSGISERISEML
jgi:hypothetical protein